MEQPTNDFIAYRVGPFGMKLCTASSGREWIDQTDQGFGNRCLPMRIANQAGWVVLNDRPLRAKWLGGTRLSDVVIEQVGDPPHSALSHFGHGILTFTIPFLFRTAAGTGLLFRGPANSPKDAIAALEGLVETEWSIATATMNWKFTRANTWIEFAYGEAICMVVPQKFDSLENLHPRILDIREYPDTYAGYEAWKKSRGEFIESLRKLDPETVKQAWQRHYFHGSAPHVEPNWNVLPHEHRTRLKLLEFIEGDHPVTDGRPFPVDTGPGSRFVERICQRPGCADYRLTTKRNDSKPIAERSLPYLKESFLCADECAALIALIERYAKCEPNLEAKVCTERRTEVAARSVYGHGLTGEAELLSKIRLRCQVEIEAHFVIERPIYPEFMMLQGNYPGDGRVRHADNRRYDEATNKWIPNHTPQRVITSGVYLNRCGSDFTGGELVFPALGKSIAPSPGLFVAYPSDERFEHEVPTVQSGARYALLLWFTDDPSFAEAPW